MNDQIFLDSYVKGSTFLTTWYMHTFSLRDFSRLLILLVFNALTAIFVLQPAINGYKKSKDSILIGQYFGLSSF